MQNTTNSPSQYLAPEKWFDCWWQPREFLAEVRQHNEQVPDDVFFRAPELKPLREAYAAALFAGIREESKTCSLRMISAPFPDFQMRFNGEIQDFELTEADRLGRRRGDEYRNRREAGLPLTLEHVDPDAEEKAAIPRIADVIGAKAQKLYDPPPHLLVYVNFSLFRALQLTNRQAAELIEPWRESFASVWLLWGANVVRCWPNPCKTVARDMPVNLLG